MEPESFAEILRERCGLEPGCSVIIACSGGADSLALLLLFRKLESVYPLHPVCVHVEHGIRGEASRQDAAFVRAFCEERQIPFRLCVLNVAEEARKKRIGIEAAARELRYQALERAREEVHASVIAVAHHRRDQAETILMHLLRGCDPDALAGMQWREDKIIRPLLETDPEELKDYLRKEETDWCEDATNSDIAYTRNRIRHCVLPEMEKAYPGATAALCRLGQAAGRDRAYFIDQLASLDLPGRIYPFPGGLAIPVRGLAFLHQAILSRALVTLVRMTGLPAQSRDKIEAVVKLVQSSRDSAENLTGDGRARLWRGMLILVRPFTTYPAVLSDLPGQIATCYGTFSLKPAGAGDPGDGRHAQAVPSELLTGARIVPAEDGQVFVPFGRRDASGTVMSFLSKIPIPAEIRKRMPVVVDGDGRILWIPGIRPSEAIRSSDETRLMLTWEQSRGIENIVREANACIKCGLD